MSNENQCAFCNKPMGDDNGHAACKLRKDGEQDQIIILSRCQHCYNPTSSMGRMSKLLRWAVLIIALLIIVTLTFTIPTTLGWNLNFLPPFMGAFISSVIKGVVAVLSYVTLRSVLGLSVSNSFDTAKQIPPIKERLKDGYSLVDIEQNV